MTRIETSAGVSSPETESRAAWRAQRNDDRARTTVLRRSGRNWPCRSLSGAPRPCASFSIKAPTPFQCGQLVFFDALNDAIEGRDLSLLCQPSDRNRCLVASRLVAPTDIIVRWTLADIELFRRHAPLPMLAGPKVSERMQMCPILAGHRTRRRERLAATP